MRLQDLTPDELENVRRRAKNLCAMLSPALQNWVDGIAKATVALAKTAEAAGFFSPRLGVAWKPRPGPREARARVNARCARKARRRKYWEGRAAYYERRGF